MALNPEVVTAIAEACGLMPWPSFVQACTSTAKVLFLLGGWRAGKSARAAFIVFLSIFLVWTRKEGTHLIWLVGPDYEQARPEYFYISTWAGRLGLSVEASSERS